jgi:hypothetical protein
MFTGRIEIDFGTVEQAILQMVDGISELIFCLLGCLKFDLGEVEKELIQDVRECILAFCEV